MTVRCKLQLTEIADTYWGGKRVVFEARYDESIPEDRRFAKATPTGRFEMTVDNPAVFGALLLGVNYYLDLVPIPTQSN